MSVQRAKFTQWSLQHDLYNKLFSFRQQTVREGTIQTIVSYRDVTKFEFEFDNVKCEFVEKCLFYTDFLCTARIRLLPESADKLFSKI